MKLDELGDDEVEVVKKKLEIGGTEWKMVGGEWY